jgi:hypothetical protein
MSDLSLLLFRGRPLSDFLYTHIPQCETVEVGGHLDALVYRGAGAMTRACLDTDEHRVWPCLFRLQMGGKLE